MMINNTDRLYLIAKDFQDKRNKLEDEFKHSMKEIKRYEGTLFFAEHDAELRRQYKSALQPIIKETTDSLESFLSTIIESTPEAQSIIEAGKGRIEDFLRYNTSKASRAAGHRNLKRRQPFNDKEACFRLLFGVKDGRFRNFCELIDSADLSSTKVQL